MAAQFHLSGKLVDGELHLISQIMLTIFTDSHYVHACVLGTWMTQYTELIELQNGRLKLKNE